jgi:hypothetical protein
MVLGLAAAVTVAGAQSHSVQSDSLGSVALSRQAYKLYQEKQFAKSAQLYRQAVDLGLKDSGNIYNAACALALSGDLPGSLTYLSRAMAAGFRDPDHMKVDADLAALHTDPRWPDLLQRAVQNQQRWLEQHRDPEKVALVTSDIPAFWKVFDRLDRVKNPEALVDSEYFDAGSVGLQDFVASRIGSAQELLVVVRARRKYYSSARESTLRIATMEPAIRAGFRRLKELYPDAIFPDTYFVIGKMNSGGTTSSNGLLIGAEMHARTATTPVDELSDWLKGIVDPVEDIPRIVCHELIHVQQKESGKKLLDFAIHEGSADFIGEMIWGGKLDMPYMRYGRAHEAELWREFQQKMNATERTGWLYDGDSATRVADLGYFVGYRISQAYYEQAKDKKQAIADILTVSDFDSLLRASGYGDRWIAQHSAPSTAAAQ